MLQGRVVHLSAAGVSVVIAQSADRLPTIVYWGAELALHDDELSDLVAVSSPAVRGSSADVPYRPSLLPEATDGWAGRVGVEGHRAGAAWSPRFEVFEARLDDELLDPDAVVHSGAAALVFAAVDHACGLRAELRIELGENGLLRSQATIADSSGAAEPFDLAAVRIALPVPTRVSEVLTFGGGWAEEKIPQRQAVGYGAVSRESRRGRTGLDATTVLVAGETGFDFRSGEVWVLHVGFSGNHEHTIERVDDSLVLVGGEILLPGEVRLAPGGEYRSPWVYGSYGAGMDDSARRFHDHLRARTRAFSRPRPVTLNVWEAVYFDQQPAKLEALAAAAASIGVERFVLDDGWFHGRNNDRAGLGDWSPDSGVWPDGLSSLSRQVEELGMEFGLWVEPEMINLDSDTARAHPDWILRARPELPVESRHQQVLDLTNPAAYRYLLEALSAVIEDARVAYLKWDHNRDLVEAGHPSTGAAAVHDQTIAVYALMDALRARFPRLEIESCSSGGGRIDLGVLERTDRVWPSDNMDPIDRARILRWTGLLVPPAMTGSHVASSPSHVTGRTQALDYRAAVAFLGHFGVEWDLTSAPAEDLERLAGWIARYKEFRELIRDGDVVNANAVAGVHRVRGVVSRERDEGIFVVLAPPTSVLHSSTVRLPGLDSGARYGVRIFSTAADAENDQRATEWFRDTLRAGAGDAASKTTVLAGGILGTAGLVLPANRPESAVLVHVSQTERTIKE